MKLTRQTPRGSVATSRRREERNEHRVELDKNTDESREPGVQVRGSIINDVWEAAQRTVKLIQTSGETRERREKVHGRVSSRPELCAVNKADGKSQEKVSHFQLVLAELKAKTQARTQSKHAVQEMILKHEGSPVSNSPCSQYGSEIQEDNESPFVEEGKAFSSSSDQGSPTSLRTWINKTGIFQKGSLVSERFQFGAISLPRRKAQNRTPPRLPTQMFKTRRNNNTSDDEFSSSINNRRHLRFEKDSSSPRKLTRFNLPFKKKNTEIDRRSKSLGYLELQDGIHLKEGVDYESIDDCSDTQLAREVKYLLVTMASCERRLVGLRMETERNTADLRSEVRRLNDVVESITHYQELRYRSLLDDIQENQRTLGQIESGLDYLLSSLNRCRGSVFQKKLYRLMWFLLDHTIASLLTLVQIFTTFYSRYRFKK